MGFENFQHTLEVNMGEHFFHYCDYDALCGIFSKKKFWMTFYQDFKDKNEITLGIKHLELIKNKEPKKIAEIIDIIKNSYICIASFTTQKHSNFHWVHYGEYCIEVGSGFMNFHECIYDMDKQMEIINSCFPDCHKNIFSVQQLRAILLSILRCKGKEYCKEYEVRGFWAEKPTELICENNKLYFQYPIELSKIYRIWITPHAKDPKDMIGKLNKLVNKTVKDSSLRPEILQKT